MMQQKSRRARQMSILLGLLADANPGRCPYIETGTRWDRIYLFGNVRFLIARNTESDVVEAGDIFGARHRPIVPNLKWYYGNLENVDKWDWSGEYPVPVSDQTVVAGKRYAKIIHYRRIRAS